MYCNNMTDRKFHKTTIVVEVLTEEPIPDTLSLAEIIQESSEGGYSYKWGRNPGIILNGKEAAEALIEQGSDADFFNLTEGGEDANE